MVGHGRSSAGSCLADPTSPIPSHCASVVATSTVRVKYKYVFGVALYTRYVICKFTVIGITHGQDMNSLSMEDLGFVI